FARAKTPRTAKCVALHLRMVPAAPDPDLPDWPDWPDWARQAPTGPTGPTGPDWPDWPDWNDIAPRHTRNAPCAGRPHAARRPLLGVGARVEARGHDGVGGRRLHQHLAGRRIVGRIRAGIAVEALIIILRNGHIPGLRDLHPNEFAVPLALHEGLQRATLAFLRRCRARLVTVLGVPRHSDARALALLPGRRGLLQHPTGL